MAPDFVLDAANGFAFVGSGTGFAPELDKIENIQIQGLGYNSGEAFQFTFDNLAIVPEPTSMMILGLGAVSLLKKRRS